MRLATHMSRSGSFLFRWRSYLPLVFLPFLFFAILQGERIEATAGETLGTIWGFGSILIVVTGELIRILTVGFVSNGTSGRNTTRQIATELNTSGTYSLVRNPLYLGNCMIYVGIALYTQSVELGLIMALVLLPYYERIIAAEETFLSERFGQDYDDWADRTPAFLPRLTGFVRPERGFSFKAAIRREHPSVFGALFLLYIVELGLHWLGEGNGVSPVWHWIMAVAVPLELAVIWVKRRTALLND